ncbi:MAG: NAD(P)-dependent oxidoreductase, partial [Actinobacteria bacterium]|nr:NAD(P)-dependent oxidoreductase [Actinomycetota bacterium]
MKVAFIGTGSMGGGMSRNLALAGVDITVFDLNTDSMAKPIEAGAKAAASALECVAGADVLITMLPTPAAVEACMISGGVANVLGEGALWVDMSTSIPEPANRVVSMTKEKGLRLIDAPVSGFATGAANGGLSIFAGGNEADIADAKPLFDIMGNPERFFNCGKRGTGYAVKLVLNMLWYDYFVSSVEALMLGIKSGVDLEVLRTALVGSPVNSVILEKDIIPLLRDGDYDEGFAVALVCKDMGLAVDLAR